MMKRTPFATLAETFEQLERTSSSSRMVDILAGFLSRVSPQEARVAAYLLHGRVAPDYEGIELGMADRLVLRALAVATGVPGNTGWSRPA
jgi:DNA ligase-1